MSSKIRQPHGRTAREVMQEAMREYDRELSELKAMHQLEVEALLSDVAELKRAAASRPAPDGYGGAGGSSDEKELNSPQVQVPAAVRKSPRSVAAPRPTPQAPRMQAESVQSLPPIGDSSQIADISDDEVLVGPKLSEVSGPKSSEERRNTRRSGSAEESLNGTPKKKPATKKGLTTLLSKEEATSNQTALVKFVLGPFDQIVCFVIAVNSVFLFFQQQYIGQELASAAGLPGQDPTDEGVRVACLVVEHVLNAFFLFEVIFRIAALKWFFVHDRKTGRVEWLNLFDVVIVLLTSVDLYLNMSNTQGGGVNFTVFRLVRFMRLVKISRLGASTAFFHKLRVLLSTVWCSMLALFWSIVLLFITMLIASLFLSQFVCSSLGDPRIDMETQEWMFHMYGTSTRAYWSLFELTFSGGWPAFARPLVDEVSPAWSLFFFVYIVIVQFAMFRIITALFLRDTLALAANDAENAVHEKLRMQKGVANHLLDFFNEADTSNDGMLSQEEFLRMLENPKIRAWLSVLEVEVSDAMEVFDLLQAGDVDDGMVDADEFVNGMTRIKGSARSQDVLKLMHTGNMLKHEMGKVKTSLAELQAHLGSGQELKTVFLS